MIYLASQPTADRVLEDGLWLAGELGRGVLSVAALLLVVILATLFSRALEGRRKDNDEDR